MATFIAVLWMILVGLCVAYALGFRNALLAVRQGDRARVRSILWAMFRTLFLVAGLVIWIKTRGRDYELGLCVIIIPLTAMTATDFAGSLKRQPPQRGSSSSAEPPAV